MTGATTTRRPGLVIWFCGLSGAGKSTIAGAIRQHLEDAGCKVLVLDGDDIRDQTVRSLGFSKADILENNRMISERCADSADAYDVILVPIISPLKQARDTARARIGPNFSLLWCKADIATVEERDVKGLYARARRGEITDLVGYSPGGVPFESPVDADIVVDSGRENLAQSIEKILKFLSIGLPGRRIALSSRDFDETDSKS
jgi:adenylylsulfate kinase